MSSAGRVGAGWLGAEVTAYAAVNSTQTCADVLLSEPLSTHHGQPIPRTHQEGAVQLWAMPIVFRSME